MKKIFSKSLIRTMAAGMMLMAATSVDAQISLGSLSNVIGSELSSVISSSNNVTVDQITGMWSYSEPAVSFESSNLLKKAGGQVASAVVEKKLATQLAKAGITAGKFKISFDANGNFVTYKNGAQTSSGTYTLSGSKITMSYLSGAAAITGYAQISNGVLSLTYDSSKLLTVVSKASKYTTNSTLSTISELAGSYDGMKSGMAFKKVTTVVKTTTTTTTTSTAKKKTATKKVVKKTSKKKK